MTSWANPRREGLVECILPGSDHTTFWLKGGRPAVYATQPYQLSSANLDKIIEFCKHYRLELRISTDDSWHNPGETTLVMVARRGVLASKKAKAV